MEIEGNNHNHEATPPPPASPPHPVENQPPPPPQPQPQPVLPVAAVINNILNNNNRLTYYECTKNHASASAMGVHSVDGCNEFFPGGPEGTIESFNCGACQCHRNFHRKETSPLFAAFYRSPSGYFHLRTPGGGPTPTAFAQLPSPGTGGGVVHVAMQQQDHEGDYVLQPLNNGGVGGSNSNNSVRKRHRTKFTAEQKEKMLSFAERIAWKIQRHDEADIRRFCNETGVSRHVFKVWMHNNKNTLGKKP